MMSKIWKLKKFDWIINCSKFEKVINFVSLLKLYFSKSNLPDLETTISGDASKTLFWTSIFFSNSLAPITEIIFAEGKKVFYVFALSAAPLAA